MPLPLPWRPFAHGGLESAQLGDKLQVFDGLNGFRQELFIVVLVVGLLEHCFQEDGVLLQVLRRAIEEMLQVQLDRLPVSGVLPRTLLE